jgi:hypothetical protein
MRFAMRYLTAGVAALSLTVTIANAQEPVQPKDATSFTKEANEAVRKDLLSGRCHPCSARTRQLIFPQLYPSWAGSEVWAEACAATGSGIDAGPAALPRPRQPEDVTAQLSAAPRSPGLATRLT